MGSGINWCRISHHSSTRAKSTTLDGFFPSKNLKKIWDQLPTRAQKRQNPPGWRSSASRAPPRAAPRAPSPAERRASARRRGRRPWSWSRSLELAWGGFDPIKTQGKSGKKVTLMKNLLGFWGFQMVLRCFKPTKQFERF